MAVSEAWRHTDAALCRDDQRMEPATKNEGQEPETTAVHYGGYKGHEGWGLLVNQNSAKTS